MARWITIQSYRDRIDQHFTAHARAPQNYYAKLRRVTFAVCRHNGSPGVFVCHVTNGRILIRWPRKGQSFDFWCGGSRLTGGGDCWFAWESVHPYPFYDDGPVIGNHYNQVENAKNNYGVRRPSAIDIQVLFVPSFISLTKRGHYRKILRAHARRRFVLVVTENDGQPRVIIILCYYYQIRFRRTRARVRYGSCTNTYTRSAGGGWTHFAWPRP